MTTSIRVERGTWLSIRPCEEGGVKICEDEIRARGIVNSGTWLWVEGNIKLMNTWLNIQSAFGIPEFSNQLGSAYNGIIGWDMSCVFDYLPASVGQYPK